MIEVNFLLNNNDRNWIKLKAVAKQVKGNQVGIEFTGLNDRQRKCIGFYLMPWNEYECDSLRSSMFMADPDQQIDIWNASLLSEPSYLSLRVHLSHFNPYFVPEELATTFCARFNQTEV